MMADPDTKLGKQSRYWGFFIAAIFVVGVGIAYSVGGLLLYGVFIFQWIVVVSTLLISGGFLALWWYSASVKPID